MAESEIAINWVLGNEGGFSDNPADSGGATNFGLSLRFLKSLPEERAKKYGFFGEITVEVLRDMPVEQAKLVYRGEFWEAAPFEKIYNQTVANYIFDMCVQSGINQGVKLLQRALWAANKQKDILIDDGIMGERTLALIGSSLLFLLPCLIAERAGFARLIAMERSKDREFLNGWLNRCYRT